MKKINKKIMIGFGALTATVTPVTAVVACGSSSSSDNYDSYNYVPYRHTSGDRYMVNAVDETAQYKIYTVAAPVSVYKTQKMNIQVEIKDITVNRIDVINALENYFNLNIKNKFIGHPITVHMGVPSAVNLVTEWVSQLWNGSYVDGMNDAVKTLYESEELLEFFSSYGAHEGHGDTGYRDEDFDGFITTLKNGTQAATVDGPRGIVNGQNVNIGQAVRYFADKDFSVWKDAESRIQALLSNGTIKRQY